MQYSIITPNNFDTIKWSGGTSTELLIYPPNSDYKQGNFDFRLSTATVEVEKSNFTSLPGISRKLMILEGEIEITHENQYRKKLAKFDIDSFEGDWKTSSIGKCVDFNLMTRGNTNGELTAISIAAKEKVQCQIEDTIEHLVLYILTGAVLVHTNEEIHRLPKGNLLVIHQLKDVKIKIEAKEDSELIESKIFK
ncbi:HutD family protein [Labilibaculum sp. DW002]|uniref:HutD family protein n=1 Tax=Paralabilibaculum antarcticum TaxID=2912572 RepID=A0ABT5VXZ0_9BACT|nr:MULTISPECIES: HutD family protein [unclassified Labilibaculum]MBI9059585.1 HutD family protein [Labilibaculum sp.]MDE5420135.1 HutD family protein [Labilibaculum sp. DW002]